MNQLGQLKELFNNNQEQDSAILAVSIDSPEDARKALEKLSQVSPALLTFPLLFDRDHQVIDRYGLFNPEGEGWPHPATYILDRSGVVVWKHVEVDFRKRPSNAVILEQIQKIE